MQRAGRLPCTAGRRLQAITLTGQRRFEELGAGSLLYTNVDVEGLQQGVRFEPVKRLIDHVDIPLLLPAGYLHGRMCRAAGCRGVRGSARLGPVQREDHTERCTGGMSMRNVEREAGDKGDEDRDDN